MSIGLLLLGILTGGVGSWLALSTLHARRIKKQRSGLTIDDFIKEFEGSSYTKEAIQITYNDLTRKVGLPIKRFDLLYPTLSRASDDIEDVLQGHGRGLGLYDDEINLILKNFL